MQFPLRLLTLALAGSPTANGQVLSKYDALLLRDRDEVIVAGPRKISELQRALGFAATVSEWRSYRKKGEADFRVHAYITTGSEAGRLGGLFVQVTYAEAIVGFGKAEPESILRLSDETLAVVYATGLSSNDGHSLECIMPMRSDGTFVRIAANSIGFSEGDDTRGFERRFRDLALRYCEAIRKGEANKRVDPTSGSAPRNSGGPKVD